MADSKNDRAPSRDLRVLRRLFGLLKPYRGRVALAGISLTLAAGAVLVNGGKAAADARLTPRDLLHGRVALLRRGKKNWHAVRAGA